MNAEAIFVAEKAINIYIVGMQNADTKSYTPTQRDAYNRCIRGICAVYKFLGGTKETITRWHLYI